MTFKIYKLQRYGKLLTLKAVIPDPNGVYQGIRLLVDTGAVYTVLPVGFLASLGYPITPTTQRLTISTANGITKPLRSSSTTSTAWGKA
jgi:predicted aspartyl protease